MRTEVMKADTIDVAVEKILIELAADTTSSIENTIYFDGCDGLGASAVLQTVAESLTISNELATRPMGLVFEKIIHIDCSKWESRRAMQRVIAQQLKLPNWVMEMFDKQDEEDDFNGLDQSSRSEIALVVRVIYQTTRNRRFLVILHNGSIEVIDIFEFGLSLDRYANSKMLWTFQGRFRLDPKIIDNVKKSRTTDIVLSALRDQHSPQELWSYLVLHEAAQVSCNKHGNIILDPAIAAESVLYMLKQFSIGSHIIDYDWGIHTSNYWVCDGIIALSDIDKAWKVGDVLQREVHLLNTNNWLNSYGSTAVPSSHIARSAERMPYWISRPTCGFVQNCSGVILDNMFQHSHKLSVLKLSWCTFSFATPPFLCCHSLRFLWLEHCQDLLPIRSTTDHHHTDADKELDNSNTTAWECFQSLWVLDLCYTDCDQILSARVMDLMAQLRELNVMGANNWDMSHLRGRLRNIRKLRVTKSTCCFNNNVFSEMESLELLDFSGNTIRQGMSSLSGAASNSNLKTVRIDGYDGLEVISMRGCKVLENLFFKGLFESLEELNLSGTKVKTLNLRDVGTSSLLPKRIILLGCEKLHAILWPQEVEIQGWHGLLRIDTTSTSASADGGEAPHAHPHGDRSLQQQKEEKFNGGWQISLTDTRLLGSFSHASFYSGAISMHIDICPAATVGAHSNVQGTSRDKLVLVQLHTSTIMDSKYRDILKDGPVVTMMMWDCPTIYVDTWPVSLTRTIIIKVVMHGGQRNKLLDNAPSASTSALLLPDTVCNCTRTLHVYDNSSIASIPETPEGLRWYNKMVPGGEVPQVTHRLHGFPRQ